MSKFLMATLKDGTRVVSEFSKLGGTGEGYSLKVFNLSKPFNAWKVVGQTHPASGEPTLVRERVMYNGADIVSIQQVKPLNENHGMSAENFVPVVEVQHGEYGNWTAPAQNTPPGAIAGLDYPVHRDPADLRRYVILKVEQAPTAVGGEPTPEVRFYVDATASRGPDWSEDADDDEDSAQAHIDGPGDADDDRW